MKKRSFWMALCALMSAFSMFATTACGGAVTETPDTPDTPPAQETPDTPENPGDPVTPDTPDTPEVPDTPVVPDNPDAPDAPDTPDTPDTPTEPEVSSLVITAPTGTVYPYVDAAKAFLEAGEGVDVYDYKGSYNNPYVPIKVKWTFDAEGATKFLVEYATQADYSDALTMETGASKRAVELYNLYRGATYYVRISALNSKGEAIETAESQFQTTDLGPRVMNVDGIFNVRDLGGYNTSFGKKIQQGLIYRGGALTVPGTGYAYQSVLSEKGKKTMSEEMGIKSELDLRTPQEAGITGGSVIPGAELTYITVGGYEAIFTSTTNQERYREIFSYFSNESNYPIYYHCTGGADRTGTLSYMLLALLGVSELECHQDFAFTTFSLYGVRASSVAGTTHTDNYQLFHEYLNKQPGATQQEKAENYLLSIGVTEDEIYNIKAIMFGEPTRVGVQAPDTFVQGVDSEMVLKISGGKTPSKLYLGGIETPFAYEGGKMVIAAANVPALTIGNVTGKIVFADGVEAEFTFAYNEMKLLNVDDCFAFDGDGKVVLTADKQLLSGTKAVGYGDTVALHLQTTTVEKTNGGYRVFIGSYGFENRGGEIRPYTLDANGTMKEVMRDGGLTIGNTILNDGATLYMSVEFVDGKAVMTLEFDTDGVVHTFTYTFENRVANEIASDNATVSVWIRVDAVTSLTIYNSEGWKNRA